MDKADLKGYRSLFISCNFKTDLKIFLENENRQSRYILRIQDTTRDQEFNKRLEF